MFVAISLCITVVNSEKHSFPVLTAGLKGFGAVFGRQYMDKGTTWLEIKDVQATGNVATHETTCANGADGFVLL